MTEDLRIRELMDRMPAAFQPQKAGGVEAVIQYHLTGEESGDWVIRIEGGECKVERGTADDPTLTLTADSDDYIKVVTGQLNGMTAFAQGKLKLKGDISLAMKLQNFFKMPA